MAPAFADDTAVSRPLYVVTAEAVSGFLAGQSAAVRGWLEASGFTAALGDLRLIPGEAGVAAAVIGFGNAPARARARFALAKAVGLPSGAWHLVGDLTRQLRRLQRMAENLGMVSLGVVAGDLRACMECCDTTAFAAVWARLLRIAERSLASDKALLEQLDQTPF